MEDNRKILENLKSTMKIENCILEDEDIKLFNSFLNKEVTEDQCIQKIKSEFI